MTNPDVLEKLRDIHLPDPVSAWPPGPAYYILMAIVLVLLLCLIQRQRHLRYTAPKRHALAELTRLEKKYNSQASEAKPTAAAVMLLLKRVALVYHPRIEVANLHGDAWRDFLKKTSRHLDEPIDATQAILCEAPFNPKTQQDLAPLFFMTRRWIKQRRKRCLN